MSAGASILLVEDDAKLAHLVCAFLQQHDYHTHWIAHGNEVAKRLQQADIDLILLDVNLPGLSGFEICRSIRAGFGGPILMLTARSGDFDQLQGLETGADDYLCKPLDPILLLARIRAHLRRDQRHTAATEHERKTPAATAPDSQIIQFDGLKIFLSSREVYLHEQRIALTSGEYALLAMLAAHAGELVTREHLYVHLLRRPYAGVDRAIDGRISQLRRKLGDHADEPQRIKTVWGAGYLLAPDAWR